MGPIRIIIFAGCAMALLGAGYLSFYGVGRQTRDLAASTQSIRTGSSSSTGGFFGGNSTSSGGGSGGFAAFGRIK